MITNLPSKWMLDAVERWADGYVLFREFGFQDSIGRFDGLLIPISRQAHCMRRGQANFWERPRLVGVEVKTSRPDFLRGLRSGQFERYSNGLSGLYLAAWSDVCKTAELPAGVGHLIVRRKAGRFTASCRRHPRYQDRDWPVALPWLLMFRLYEQFRDRERDLWRERARIREKIGAEAGLRIFRVLKLIEERAIAELAEAEAATCG